MTGHITEYHQDKSNRSIGRHVTGLQIPIYTSHSSVAGYRFSITVLRFVNGGGESALLAISVMCTRFHALHTSRVVQGALGLVLLTSHIETYRWGTDTHYLGTRDRQSGRQVGKKVAS